MSKYVCLDAGHGGKDPGATGFGRQEKNDVLKLVLRVRELLEKMGVSVYLTRNNDIYETPYQKATEANVMGVSFFASFHRNAANGKAKGFETLVYSNVGAAKTCADAANAAMKKLGFTDRGTKVRTDLTVLNTTRMPAVLFEVGFIDNKSDNTLFVDKFEQIAKGLADAVAQAVGVKIKEDQPKQEPGTAKNSIGLKYRGSVQSLGVCAWVHDGQVCGTVGDSLRLEGLQIDIDALRKVKGYSKIQIDALAHVQNLGDVTYENLTSDTWIGTKDGKRLEGLELQVKGLPKGKALKFQVHEQNKGWSSTATADEIGAFRGSVGESRRIEAVRIWVE